MRHSCFLVLALSLSVAVAVDVRRVKAKVVVSGPQGVLAAPAKEGKYDPCAGKADGAVCKMCDPAAKGCAEDRALRMCAKGACVVGGKTAGAKAKGTVSEKDGAPVATAAAAKDKKNSKAKGDKVKEAVKGGMIEGGDDDDDTDKQDEVEITQQVMHVHKDPVKDPQSNDLLAVCAHDPVQCRKLKAKRMLEREAMLALTKPTNLPTEIGEVVVHPIPVNCVLTEWADAGDCSKTCGGGLKEQSRRVKVAAQYGGQECDPELAQLVKCNEQACPVDCVVGPFTDNGKCSKSCGGGIQKLHRKVLVEPAHGGKKCPALEDEEFCNTHKCPIHCKMGDWGEYGPCSAECGDGKKKRVRVKVQKALHGGAECEDERLDDFDKCFVKPCPVDCKMGPWSMWSKCDKQCGPGTKRRTRIQLVKSAHGGAPCPDPSTLDTNNCTVAPCPVHCKVGAWVKDDKAPTCSKSCGVGIQKMVRPVLVEPLHGGNKCPSLEKEVKCNKQPCPVDCVVNKWKNTGTCSQTCGGGLQQQSRKVTTPAASGGKKCPELQQMIACNNQSCPVDCVVSAFRDQGNCTKTCGGGLQRRVRTVSRPAAHGGKKCPAKMSKDVPCNPDPCPVHCKMGNWTEWGQCTAECGPGRQTRTRVVEVEANHGGDACEDDRLKDSKNCTIKPCPVSCKLGEWGKWGDCDRDCGNGTKTRSRLKLVEAQFGGTPCPDSDLSDSATCRVKPCPVDCVVGSWKKVAGPNGGDSCTKTCGGGMELEKRGVRVPAQHGGKACPKLSRKLVCNEDPCPVDCQVTDWQDVPIGTPDVTCCRPRNGTRCGRAAKTLDIFKGLTRQVSAGGKEYCCPRKGCGAKAPEVCSAKCGGGEKKQRREVSTPPDNEGKECPVLSRTVTCNNQPCATDCAMSAWADLGECSATCGGGLQKQTRAIATKPANGGKACPALLKRTVKCNQHACPVDCKVGEWAHNGNCSAACGGGKQQEVRRATTPPAHGGAKCPALARTVACGEQPCPVDCKMGDWEDWSSCDAECGEGQSTRTRKKAQSAANGGKQCEDETTEEKKKCTSKPCPVDCKMSEWSDWDPCFNDAGCGSGQKYRSRKRLTVSSFGGADCPNPALNETAVCKLKDCAIDCAVGPWQRAGDADGGACSKTCGVGKLKEVRKVTVEPKFGGAECPALERQVDCNEDPCPVDCVVGNWTNWGSCSEDCGGGKQKQQRAVLVQDKDGGVECPELFRSVACAEDPCPSDCEVGEWAKKGECTADCGGGEQLMVRPVESPPLYNGKACPALNKTVSCNEQPCPVDCVVTDWQKAGECSASCGGGFRPEALTVLKSAQHGGEPCPSTLMRQVPCNMDMCPMDCVVTPWEEPDGNCSAPCGGGKMAVKRGVSMPAMYDGAKCPKLTKMVDCNTMPCPDPADLGCVLSDWKVDPSAAGNCSKTCGGGKQRMLKSVLQEPRTEKGVVGSPCPAPERRAKEQECNVGPCPMDCVVSKWTNLNTCSASCGGGTVTQVRSILSPAMYGGAACPAKLQRVAECNIDMCPVDCKVSEWRDEGECSATCGGGTLNRTRSIEVDPMYGGKACPADLAKLEPCNSEPCPVDCEVGPWENSGNCSATCGGGAQKQTKEVLVPAQYGGMSCPATEQSLPCGEAPCPVDCEMGDWTGYGECDAQCGAGQKERTRTKAVDAMYSGEECADESLSQSVKCLADPCPVDCKMSEWAAWGQCSSEKGCGKGSRTRTRRKLTTSLFGGQVCPDPSIMEVEDCDLGPCSVDCKMSEWSSWGECESHKGCGAGVKVRTRHELAKVAFGGKTCPTDHRLEKEPCQMERACDRDCQMSEWRTVKSCTRTCGGGIEAQVREVEKQAVAGGLPCGKLSRTVSCNEQACPSQDCKLGPWIKATMCTASCGGGTLTEMRHVLSPPRHGGALCESTVRQTPCNTEKCPGVDCAMTAWIDTTACMAGKKVQIRRVQQEAQQGGKPCPSDTTRTVDCVDPTPPSEEGCSKEKCKKMDLDLNTAKAEISSLRQEIMDIKTKGMAVVPAVVSPGAAAATLAAGGHRVVGNDCVLSDWTPGACTKTCGTGTMTMIRTVVSPPTNGGKSCQGEMTRQAECNIKPCTGDRGKRVSRFTDFDGDLRTDIALVGLVPASGAAQLPVAFSNGRQGVTVNDNAGAMTDFVQRAGVQGVTSLFGDYDGDGRTDVALLGAIKEGKVAWPIPVAFSTGRTGFKTNYKAEVVKTDASTGVSTVPQAELVRTWSTSSRKLMGDFDGDGRSDIALLVNSEEGLSAMPVLFSDFPSSEKWTLVDSQVGPFSSWCHSTKAAVGDFDGDGYSDIVCTGGSKWETVSDAIPVAYSTGRKGWKVEIGEAEKFISQAASEGTQMVLGDFDGDGKTDIAAIGSNMATIPVAFSNGRGQWASSVTPSSADVNGAIAGVAGDFDGDGKDDILLIGAGKATSSVTVLYSKGREGWTVRSEQVGSWAQQATLKGARYLVGDYDGDGRADVCLTGVAGWSELMFIYGKADSRGLVSSPQSAGVFASQAAQLSVKGDNLLQTEEIRSHLI